MPTQAQLQARVFASTERTRYVLNSVLIRANGDVVATDGKRLAIIGPSSHSGLREKGAPPEKDIMVYADALKDFFKVALKPRRDNYLLEAVEVQQLKKSCTFKQAGGRIIRMNYPAPEGHFPDVNEVMPKKDSFVTDITVGAKLLGSICHYVKKYSDNGQMRICVPINKKGAIEIHTKGDGGEDMLFLLMPVDHAGDKFSREDRKGMKFEADVLRARVKELEDNLSEIQKKKNITAAKKIAKKTYTPSDEE